MQIDFERIVNFKCNSVALIIIEWRCKRNYTSRHQTIWNDSESHCAYYSGIYIVNSTDDVTFFRQYSVYGCQQFSCKVQSSRWWCATPSDFVCNLWEELSIMNLSKCLFSEAICYFLQNSVDYCTSTLQLSSITFAFQICICHSFMLVSHLAFWSNRRKFRFWSINYSNTLL